MDHYASLGVSRTSEDVVIRAAYLALMRRYHPDGNPSLEAAERVRAITTAYEVLGDATRRRDYDRGWDPEDATLPVAGPGRPLRAGPLSFALTMLCMSLLVGIIWARQPMAVATGGAPRVADAGKVPPASPEPVTCLSPQIRNLVEREVIRQAANLQRGDRAAFASMAGTVSARTSPALTVSQPRPGLMECAAAVNIVLPQNVTAGQDKAALFGNVEFMVADRGAEGLSLIEFNPDDRFLVEFASIRRAPPSSTGQPVSVERPSSAVAAREIILPAPPRFQRAEGSTDAPASSTAHRPPVISRARAVPTRATRSKADIAEVRIDPCKRRSGAMPAPCDEENLRVLGQQLQLFERQSLLNADAAKRETLRQGQKTFEASRKACTTTSCLRASILSRTTEIADIMRKTAH